MSEEKRKRQSVMVDADAYDSFMNTTAWSEIPLRTKVSKVLMWLSEQPEEIQGLIMGGLPQSRRSDFTRMILEGMLEDVEEQPQELKLAARKKTTPHIRRNK